MKPISSFLRITAFVTLFFFTSTNTIALGDATAISSLIEKTASRLAIRPVLNKLSPAEARSELRINELVNSHASSSIPKSGIVFPDEREPFLNGIPDSVRYRIRAEILPGLENLQTFFASNLSAQQIDFRAFLDGLVGSVKQVLDPKINQVNALVIVQQVHQKMNEMLSGSIRPESLRLGKKLFEMPDFPRRATDFQSVFRKAATEVSGKLSDLKHNLEANQSSSETLRAELRSSLLLNNGSSSTARPEARQIRSDARSELRTEKRPPVNIAQSLKSFVIDYLRSRYPRTLFAFLLMWNLFVKKRVPVLASDITGTLADQPKGEEHPIYPKVGMAIKNNLEEGPIYIVSGDPKTVAEERFVKPLISGYQLTSHQISNLKLVTQIGLSLHSYQDGSILEESLVEGIRADELILLRNLLEEVTHHYDLETKFPRANGFSPGLIRETNAVSGVGVHYFPAGVGLTQKGLSKLAASVLKQDNLLARMRDDIQRRLLEAHLDRIEVRVGGDTAFDITTTDKGRTLTELKKRFLYSNEYFVYFGDRIFRGGNDAEALRVAEIGVQVGPHRDLQFHPGNAILFARKMAPTGAVADYLRILLIIQKLARFLKIKVQSTSRAELRNLKSSRQSSVVSPKPKYNAVHSTTYDLSLKTNTMTELPSPPTEPTTAPSRHDTRALSELRQFRDEIRKIKRLFIPTPEHPFENITRIKKIQMMEINKGTGEPIPNGISEHKELLHAATIVGARTSTYLRTGEGIVPMLRVIGNHRVVDIIRRFFNLNPNVMGIIKNGATAQRIDQFYMGERIGIGISENKALALDITVIPVEVVHGIGNRDIQGTASIRVYAEKGSIRSLPWKIYWDKFVVGPNLKDAYEKLTQKRDLTDRLQIVAEAKGKPVSDLRIALLFRDRTHEQIYSLLEAGIDMGERGEKIRKRMRKHEFYGEFIKEIEEEIREKGYAERKNVLFLGDGDVTPIRLLQTGELDIITGSSPSAQTSVSAAWVKAIGGEIYARPMITDSLNAVERDHLRNFGIEKETDGRIWRDKFPVVDFSKVWRANDFINTNNFKIVLSAIKQVPFMKGKQKSIREGLPPARMNEDGNLEVYVTEIDGDTGTTKIWKVTLETEIPTLKKEYEKISGTEKADIERKIEIDCQIGIVYARYGKFDLAKNHLNRGIKLVDNRGLSALALKANLEVAEGLEVIVTRGLHTKGGAAIYLERAHALMQDMENQNIKMDLELYHAVKRFLSIMNESNGDFELPSSNRKGSYNQAANFYKKALDYDPENVRLLSHYQKAKLGPYIDQFWDWYNEEEKRTGQIPERLDQWRKLKEIYQTNELHSSESAVWPNLVFWTVLKNELPSRKTSYVLVFRELRNLLETATQEELIMLPGVNEKIASAIIQHRTDFLAERGAYRDTGRILEKDIDADVDFFEYLVDEFPDHSTSVMGFEHFDQDTDLISSRTPDEALDETIEWLNHMAETYPKVHSTQGIFRKLGDAYFRKALILSNLGEPKRGEEYFKKSIKSFQKILGVYGGQTPYEAHARIIEIARVAGYNNIAEKEFALIENLEDFIPTIAGGLTLEQLGGPREVYQGYLDFQKKFLFDRLHTQMERALPKGAKNSTTEKSELRLENQSDFRMAVESIGLDDHAGIGSNRSDVRAELRNLKLSNRVSDRSLSQDTKQPDSRAELPSDLLLNKGSLRTARSEARQMRSDARNELRANSDQRMETLVTNLDFLEDSHARLKRAVFEIFRMVQVAKLWKLLWDGFEQLKQNTQTMIKEAKLWSNLKAIFDFRRYEEFYAALKQYMSKIVRVAKGIAKRLVRPSDWELLLTMGFWGFFEAWQRFLPSLHQDFWKFAAPYVSGRMWDQIREEAWLPERSFHERYGGPVQRARERLHQKGYFRPSVEEIAKEARMNVAKARRALGLIDLRVLPLLAGGEREEKKGTAYESPSSIADERAKPPSEIVETSEINRRLAEQLTEGSPREFEAIPPYLVPANQAKLGDILLLVAHQIRDLLSDVDRQIVYLFFFEGLEQKEIAKRLDFSQSYISLRLSAVSEMLRKILDEQGYGETFDKLMRRSMRSPRLGTHLINSKRILAGSKGRFLGQLVRGLQVPIGVSRTGSFVTDETKQMVLYFDSLGLLGLVNFSPAPDPESVELELKLPGDVQVFVEKDGDFHVPSDLKRVVLTGESERLHCYLPALGSFEPIHFVLTYEAAKTQASGHTTQRHFYYEASRPLRVHPPKNFRAYYFVGKDSVKRIPFHAQAAQNIKDSDGPYRFRTLTGSQLESALDPDQTKRRGSGRVGLIHNGEWRYVSEFFRDQDQPEEANQLQKAAGEQIDPKILAESYASFSGWKLQEEILSRMKPRYYRRFGSLSAGDKIIVRFGKLPNGLPRYLVFSFDWDRNDPAGLVQIRTLQAEGLTLLKINDKTGERSRESFHEHQLVRGESLLVIDPWSDRQIRFNYKSRKHGFRTFTLVSNQLARIGLWKALYRMEQQKLKSIIPALSRSPETTFLSKPVELVPEQNFRAFKELLRKIRKAKEGTIGAHLKAGFDQSLGEKKSGVERKFLHMGSHEGGLTKALSVLFDHTIAYEKSEPNKTQILARGIEGLEVVSDFDSVIKPENQGAFDSVLLSSNFFRQSFAFRYVLFEEALKLLNADGALAIALLDQESRSQNLMQARELLTGGRSVNLSVEDLAKEAQSLGYGFKIEPVSVVHESNSLDEMVLILASFLPPNVTSYEAIRRYVEENLKNSNGKYRFSVDYKILWASKNISSARAELRNLKATNIHESESQLSSRSKAKRAELRADFAAFGGAISEEEAKKVAVRIATVVKDRMVAISKVPDHQFLSSWLHEVTRLIENGLWKEAETHFNSVKIESIDESTFRTFEKDYLRPAQIVFSVYSKTSEIFEILKKHILKTIWQMVEGKDSSQLSWFDFARTVVMTMNKKNPDELKHKKTVAQILEKLEQGNLTGDVAREQLLDEFEYTDSNIHRRAVPIRDFFFEMIHALVEGEKLPQPLWRSFEDFAKQFRIRWGYRYTIEQLLENSNPDYEINEIQNWISFQIYLLNKSIRGSSRWHFQEPFYENEGLYPDALYGPFSLIYSRLFESISENNQYPRKARLDFVFMIEPDGFIRLKVVDPHTNHELDEREIQLFAKELLGQKTASFINLISNLRKGTSIQDIKTKRAELRRGDPLVLALGGNAFQNGMNESFEQQERNVRKAIQTLTETLPSSAPLIITHGNGPQVGELLLQAEEEARLHNHSPPSLAALVEKSQELMFGWIQNAYREIDPAKKVVLVKTHVLVDKNDPAFKSPLNYTKFVGNYYTMEELKTKGDVESLGEDSKGNPVWKLTIQDSRGKPVEWILKQQQNSKQPSEVRFRRVVPSPKPFQIIEAKEIKRLSNEPNTIVVAAGGGGIPVIEKDEKWEAIDAVIDKDLASALLADIVDSQLLIILTGVDRVSLNFKSGDPAKIQPLDMLTVDEAERFYQQGEFPDGSMGPKVTGAAAFVKESRNKTRAALITDAAHLAQALEGKGGTLVVQSIYQALGEIANRPELRVVKNFEKEYRDFHDQFRANLKKRIKRGEIFSPLGQHDLIIEKFLNEKFDPLVNKNIESHNQIRTAVRQMSANMTFSFSEMSWKAIEEFDLTYTFMIKIIREELMKIKLDQEEKDLQFAFGLLRSRLKSLDPSDPITEKIREFRERYKVSLIDPAMLIKINGTDFMDSIENDMDESPGQISYRATIHFYIDRSSMEEQFYRERRDLLEKLRKSSLSKTLAAVEAFDQTRWLPKRAELRGNGFQNQTLESVWANFNNAERSAWQKITVLKKAIDWSLQDQPIQQVKELHDFGEEVERKLALFKSKVSSSETITELNERMAELEKDLNKIESELVQILTALSLLKKQKALPNYNSKDWKALIRLIDQFGSWQAKKALDDSLTFIPNLRKGFGFRPESAVEQPSDFFILDGAHQFLLDLSAQQERIIVDLGLEKGFKHYLEIKLEAVSGRRNAVQIRANDAQDAKVLHVNENGISMEIDHFRSGNAYTINPREKLQFEFPDGKIVTLYYDFYNEKGYRIVLSASHPLPVALWNGLLDARKLAVRVDKLRYRFNVPSKTEKPVNEQVALRAALQDFSNDLVFFQSLLAVLTGAFQSESPDQDLAGIVTTLEIHTHRLLEKKLADFKRLEESFPAFLPSDIVLVNRNLEKLEENFNRIKSLWVSILQSLTRLKSESKMPQNQYWEKVNDFINWAAHGLFFTGMGKSVGFRMSKTDLDIPLLQPANSAKLSLLAGEEILLGFGNEVYLKLSFAKPEPDRDTVKVTVLGSRGDISAHLPLEGGISSVIPNPKSFLREPGDTFSLRYKRSSQSTTAVKFKLEKSGSGTYEIESTSNQPVRIARWSALPEPLRFRLEGKLNSPTAAGVRPELRSSTANSVQTARAELRNLKVDSSSLSSAPTFNQSNQADVYGRVGTAPTFHGENKGRFGAVLGAKVSRAAPELLSNEGSSGTVGPKASPSKLATRAVPSFNKLRNGGLGQSSPSIESKSRKVRAELRLPPTVASTAPSQRDTRALSELRTTRRSSKSSRLGVLWYYGKNEIDEIKHFPESRAYRTVRKSLHLLYHLSALSFVTFGCYLAFFRLTPWTFRLFGLETTFTTSIPNPTQARIFYLRNAVVIGCSFALTLIVLTMNRKLRQLRRQTMYLQEGGEYVSSKPLQFKWRNRYRFKLGQHSNNMLNIHMPHHEGILIYVTKQNEIHVIRSGGDSEDHLRFGMSKAILLKPGEIIMVTGKEETNSNQRANHSIQIRKFKNKGDLFKIEAGKNRSIRITRLNRKMPIEIIHRDYVPVAKRIILGENIMTIMLWMALMLEFWFSKMPPGNALAGWILAFLSVGISFAVNYLIHFFGTLGSILSDFFPEKESVRPTSTQKTYFEKRLRENRLFDLKKLSLESFKTMDEISHALEKLTLEKGKKLPVSDPILILLERLARTVTDHKEMNRLIEVHLREWLLESKETKVHAAIIAGWLQAEPVTENDGAKYERLPGVLKQFLAEKLKMPEADGKAVTRIGEATYEKLSYESVRKEKPSENASPPYPDQIRNRTLYGMMGDEEISRIVQNLETINSERLKKWLEIKLRKKYPQFLEIKVASLIVYGSYLYGVRPDPTDLDIHVIVTGVPFGAKLAMNSSEQLMVDKSIFRTIFARFTDHVDIHFMTHDELFEKPEILTMAANVGIVLRGKGLVDEPFESARASDQNRLKKAMNLLEDAEDKIERAHDTARYKNAAPVWRQKAMRRLEEANLLLTKIDPSVAIPFHLMRKLRLALRFYLDGTLAHNRFQNILKVVHSRLSTAVLLTITSRVYQKLEELQKGERAELRKNRTSYIVDRTSKSEIRSTNDEIRNRRAELRVEKDEGPKLRLVQPPIYKYRIRDLDPKVKQALDLLQSHLGINEMGEGFVQLNDIISKSTNNKLRIQVVKGLILLSRREPGIAKRTVRLLSAAFYYNFGWTRSRIRKIDEALLDLMLREADLKENVSSVVFDIWTGSMRETIGPRESDKFVDINLEQLKWFIHSEKVTPNMFKEILENLTWIYQETSKGTYMGSSTLHNPTTRDYKQELMDLIVETLGLHKPGSDIYEKAIRPYLDQHRKHIETNATARKILEHFERSELRLQKTTTRLISQPSGDLKPRNSTPSDDDIKVPVNSIDVKNDENSRLPLTKGSPTRYKTALPGFEPGSTLSSEGTLSIELQGRSQQNQRITDINKKQEIYLYNKYSVGFKQALASLVPALAAVDAQVRINLENAIKNGIQETSQESVQVQKLIEEKLSAQRAIRASSELRKPNQNPVGIFGNELCFADDGEAIVIAPQLMRALGIRTAVFITPTTVEKSAAEAVRSELREGEEILTAKTYDEARSELRKRGYTNIHVVLAETDPVSEVKPWADQLTVFSQSELHHLLSAFDTVLQQVRAELRVAYSA